MMTGDVRHASSLSVIVRALIIGVLAVAALPAAAAPPSSQLARITRENTMLRAKVKRLAVANEILRAQKKVVSNDNLTISKRWHEALAREEALKVHIVGIDPCPITRPNNSQPPGDTFGSAFHGNGELWVGLPRTDIVSWQREPDGSVEAKFGWWREARGRLRIEGHRLDAPAPPLRARIPDGYGDAGFQSTAIIFPTDGCWEVTGSVGSASLTFVTLVVSAVAP